MVVSAAAGNEVAAGGGSVMATRVAGLSDEVLKAAFCRIEGRDPGRRSRGDLVAWLASKPDDEFTSTAIELARKQPPPPPDRDKGMLHMSKYSRRRIAKRREFLEIDGVGVTYNGTTAQAKLNKEDPLWGDSRPCRWRRARQRAGRVRRDGPVFPRPLGAEQGPHRPHQQVHEAPRRHQPRP